MLTIRPATAADAEPMIALLTAIASEQIYTAISRPWSVEEQRRHIAALSPREIIYVAQTSGAEFIGYQVLELWAPSIESMSHVGQLGTFLKTEWRGRGIGRQLFMRTLDFARTNNYLKFVIQVRQSNSRAHSFYRHLGFRECGRLARQVRIGLIEDDETLMEMFI